MLPVVKEMVFEGLRLPTTLYVRAGVNRYIPVGKKGENAKLQHLSNYHNEGFKLYVHRKDFQEFVDYLTGFTRKVMAADSLPAVKKASVVQSLVEVSLRDLEARQFADVQALKKASEFVCQLQSSIENFDQVEAILGALPENESKHSTIVCLMSLLILNEMQDASKQAQETLALGALLHDVGLKFVAPEILAKDPAARTREEIEIYESHPQRGVESLQSLKGISNDVLLIVAEHHERANGTGYPKRLRDVRISPLARIVGLADAFAELTHCPGGRERTPDEAIAYIQDVLGTPFNRGVFSALRNVVNRRVLQERRRAG